MSKKYPGLYLYFDWLRGLEKLPPAVAMKIIHNLWHYAEERREPVPLFFTLVIIFKTSLYFFYNIDWLYRERTKRKGDVKSPNNRYYHRPLLQCPLRILL